MVDNHEPSVSPRIIPTLANCREWDFDNRCCRSATHFVKGLALWMSAACSIFSLSVSLTSLSSAVDGDGAIGQRLRFVAFDCDTAERHALLQILLVLLLEPEPL